jgi:hypothetical protein
MRLVPDKQTGGTEITVSSARLDSHSRIAEKSATVLPSMGRNHPHGPHFVACTLISP